MNTKTCLFISRLNDAYRRKKPIIKISSNKEIKKLLKMFLSKGFLSSFKLDESSNKCKVFLNIPIEADLIRSDTIGNLGSFYNIELTNIKRPFRKISIKSKSSRILYYTANDLKYLNNKLHTIFVLNTKKGLMFSDEAANLKIGGKLLIEIIL